MLSRIQRCFGLLGKTQHRAAATPKQKNRGWRKSRDDSSREAPVPAMASRQDLLLRCGLYPAIIIAVVLVCSIRPIAEPDCWFHMTFGRFVRTTGGLPPGDTFSFTGHGHEWISTGWFASVLLDWLYELFNCAGPVYLVFALEALAFLAIYCVAAFIYGNRGSVLLVLLSGILASCLRFTPRPELFSHVALAAVMLLLITSEDSVRGREGHMPRRLWLLPALFAAWANLHGGFFVGFVPLAAFMLWKIFLWRKTGARTHLVWAVPCALCFFSWMINPYHARILTLLGQVKESPTIKTHLIEWMPLFGASQFALPSAAVAGVVLVIALSVWAWFRREGSIPWWRTACVLLFFVLEFQARRHVAVASLVAAAVLAAHFSRIDAILSRRPVLIPALALCAALAIGGMKSNNRLGLGKGLMITGCESTMFPCYAVEYLRSNPPPTQLFNSYGAGGYLMYYLGSQLRIFIDGRFYVYDPQVWEDYIAVQDGEMSIKEICRRYGIRTFLLYTRDNIHLSNHLANRLTSKPDWKLVYFSDAYAVFVQETAETRSYTAGRKFEYVSPFAPDRLVKALADAKTSAAAREEITRALEVSRGSANASALAALAAHSTGDHMSARQLLASAVARYPDSPTVRYAVARLGAGSEQLQLTGTWPAKTGSR